MDKTRSLGHLARETLYVLLKKALCLQVSFLNTLACCLLFSQSSGLGFADMLLIAPLLIILLWV